MWLHTYKGSSVRPYEFLLKFKLIIINILDFFIPIHWSQRQQNTLTKENTDIYPNIDESLFLKHKCKRQLYIIQEYVNTNLYVINVSFVQLR